MNRAGELPTERSDDDAQRGSRGSSVFVVTVVEGSEAGTSVNVDPASPARLLVGTSPTCTLRLSDRKVSRRHLSMRPDGVVLVVNDLGSTNGTQVNGVSVREAELRGGEAIRLGHTVLRVSRAAPSSAALPEEGAFGRLLGESAAMRRLYPSLRRLAAIDVPILLEGEAGVGKELCAEEIHAASPRASRPFLVLACHSLSAKAIEEHLFGPQGWLTEHPGDSSGTVFVDEIGALPMSVQRKLASIVASGRGGGPRLVFATRRDLDQDVAEGAFREELLVALAPRRLELPPLREREGDVPLLAQAFWSTEHATSATPEGPALPPDFLARFHRYRWPGNVRELAAAVHARATMGELARWRTTDLSDASRDFLRAVVDRELPLAEARQLAVDELERRYVDHMLVRHGSTRDAAQASGVSLRYFQMLRSRLEI